MTRNLLKSVTALFIILYSPCLKAQWDNPLVYYQFNGASGTVIADSSGNAFNGDSDCNTCWESDGKFDGAFHFSTTERIDMPAKDIALTTEKGTVAFWAMLPESSANKINCIWWAGEYGGDMFGPQNEMHICTEAGLNDQWWNHSEVAFVVVDSIADRQYFIYSDPWKGDVAATTPSDKAISIADNKWHHVACTWDSKATMAMYIDGVVIWDSMAYSPANTWACNIMTLGVANQRGNRRFNGYIDEFRLYNEALSFNEIEEIYNYIPGSIQNQINDVYHSNTLAMDIYPNPASDKIYFKNSMGITSIEIYSLTGEKYLEKQVSNVNDLVEIDIQQLSSGFYIVRAFDNNIQKAVGKLFKE